MNDYRLAVIFAGRHHCDARPTLLRVAKAAVMAVWDPAGDLLILVDGSHPALAKLAGPDPVSSDEVINHVRPLIEAPEADTPIGWSVRTAAGAVTAPLDGLRDSLVPVSDEWITKDILRSVTLRTGGSPDGGVIRHHHKPRSSTPAHAVTDLLDLLAIFAEPIPRAALAIERVLHGQPLYAVDVRVPNPQYRPLGSGGRTAVPVDTSGAFVWDRRGVGGNLHVIEATAPVLNSARTTNRAAEPVVGVGAPLPVLDRLISPDVPGLPAGDEPACFTMANAGSKWKLLSDVLVKRTEKGWYVSVRTNHGEEATSSSPHSVTRVALRSGSDTLVHEAAGNPNATAALYRISVITAGMRGDAVTVEETWPGAAAAVAATRRQAIDWLGVKAAAPDHEAVDRVVQAALRNSAEGPKLPELGAALAGVGVEDLEARHYGAQVVALLVLERELELQFGRKSRKTDWARVPVFADALTAYLVALSQASSETWPWAWQRIVRHIREFLNHRRLAKTRVMSVDLGQNMSKAGRSTWFALVRQAPWVRWLADPALDPPAGVVVTADTLVDLLTLIRPRHVPMVSGQRQYSPDTGVKTGPLPARFTQLYRTVPPVAPALLDQLAEALSPLLNDPARAARMVQALSLPPELDEVVRTRVTAAVDGRSDAANLLAVRVDDGHSPKVMLVNLAPDSGLYARVRDEPVQLAPFAVAQEGAFGYCTDPLAIGPGDQVGVGTDLIPLDAPRVPLAEGANVTQHALPADLFRGREPQMARLRQAIDSRGPRTGSLIFGTRRSGKSTLADQVSQDTRRLRGRLWLDLSDTPASVRDFGEWSRAICRRFAKRARRQLGVDLPLDATDLVELLVDLDEALDGGGPVAVVLDELDVLLLPESGADGRRTAGRLGNLTYDNLVLIGAVQRFHRSVHELKTWQTIECPPDLCWADGVTYFMGPLGDRTSGPRVEWLRRAGVAPRHFATEIAPHIGLRPYFWARLRNSLGGHVHDDRAGSRLVDVAEVRRHLSLLAVEDPHLNQVMDEGVDLEPDERRRRDLFGADERRILARFAVMGQTGKMLKTSEAVRVGGAAAVDELINRAYLAYANDGTHLRTAVPIFHEFLRARATDLLAVTPGAEPPPASPTPPKPKTVRTVVDKADVAAAAAALLDALERENPIPLGSVGAIIRAASPRLFTDRWAGPGSLTDLLTLFFPDFPLTGATGNQVVHRPGPGAPEPPASTGLTMDDLATAREAVRQALAAQNPLAVTTAGAAIRAAVPQIHKTNWARCGRLTRFLARYLPEFPQTLGPSGECYLEAPATPDAA